MKNENDIRIRDAIAETSKLHATEEELTTAFNNAIAIAETEVLADAKLINKDLYENIKNNPAKEILKNHKFSTSLNKATTDFHLLNIRINNEIDMANGCLNRISITDDFNEYANLYKSLIFRIRNIYENALLRKRLYNIYRQ